MIEMILPDSVKTTRQAMTVKSLQNVAGTSLAKATVGAIIDDVTVDTSFLIEKSEIFN